MEKQTKNAELMQERKTTTSAIAEEIFALIKDEFVCKAYEKTENGGVISLYNGQKFRFFVSEL